MALIEVAKKVGETWDFASNLLIAGAMAYAGCKLPPAEAGGEPGSGFLSSSYNQNSDSNVIAGNIVPLSYQNLDSQILANERFFAAQAEATERRIFNQLPLAEKMDLAINGKFRIKTEN